MVEMRLGFSKVSNITAEPFLQEGGTYDGRFHKIGVPQRQWGMFHQFMFYNDVL